MGINGLSVVIGLILLIAGIVFVGNSIIKNKKLFSNNGIIGITLITLSLLFIIDKLAGFIFIFIPWFLIILGATFIIDALFGKFLLDNDNLIEFIVKICIGVASITLGICLRLIDGFAEYAGIMLGILMIVYSLYLITQLFIKKAN